MKGKTNWVYTLVRAIDSLGGVATDFELAKSDFVINEQNPQRNPPASVRGAIHDYSSDFSSGRNAGARNGNVRDVFEKVDPATYKIRDTENPFVRFALRKISVSEVKTQIEKDGQPRKMIQSLLNKLELDKTVHVREHMRRLPTSKPMTKPIFHMISNGPHPVAPFSHAVEADGFIFVTGQMPTDPDAPDAPLPKGIKAQTGRVIENLQIILNGIDLGLDDIVMARIYLTKFHRDYDEMNEVWKSYFEIDCLPARTTIGVTGLALHALVEIDLVVKRKVEKKA